MPYDVLWQSSLANIVLIAGYLVYKILNRLVGSKCHYTRDHGLELHLPDPDEPMDLNQINSFFKNRGLSMRIRDKQNASIV